MSVRFDRTITFAIPTGAVAGDQPWRCGADYFTTSQHLACGCPACLHERGAVIIFNAEDYDKLQEGEKALPRCRILVVSIETAKMVPHLIVPGYEAYHRFQSQFGPPEEKSGD